MSVKVKISIDKNWSGKILNSLDAGLIDLVADAHRRAVIIAPKLSRALVNSGMISRLGFLAYSLSFGSSKVPYARKRHFENKKNPQTTGYLAKAGLEAYRGDIGKHFRNKLK